MSRCRGTLRTPYRLSAIRAKVVAKATGSKRRCFNSVTGLIQAGAREGRWFASACRQTGYALYNKCAQNVQLETKFFTLKVLQSSQ